MTGVFFFRFSSSSACWKATEDVHGFGGVPHDITLEECQSECISDSSCVAVDWDPKNTGRTCWTLTTTFTGPTTQPGFIVHYELDRDCLGKWARLVFLSW